MSTTQSLEEMTPEERTGLQTRVLRVLTAGQIVGAAALGAAATVGAFVIQDILGDETPWGGVAAATVTTGTAVMAQMLSRVMWRGGRRPGLVMGYGLAALGALVAAVGAERRLLGLFIVGLFIYGNGQASNLLARYAATDLAHPAHRGRAMSRVIFASTFGAVFGPLLIIPAQRAGQTWFELAPYTGPWLFSAACFALATLNTLRLRPDPLVIAGGTRSGSGPERTPLRRSLALAAASPTARLAIAAMAVSQAAMVAVMTMTPVHMKIHGHETLSFYVISAHIGGMFAFSPLVGRFTDRRGPLTSVLTGSTILIGSTLLAAVGSGAEWLLFPALWGLGLGWNFCLIGGSAMLVGSVDRAERVGVQGSADLLMSMCGAVAGFSSGFIRSAVGYHMLALLATASAAMLLVMAGDTRRRHLQVALGVDGR